MKPTDPGITRPAACGPMAINPRRRSIRRRIGWLLLAGVWLASGIPLPVKAELLTNAAQVLSLSADRAAQKLPVQVTGVVTAAESGWAGRFFIQDDTCGVFVELLSDVHPVPGDVVALTGVTMPGAYAPIITLPQWKKIGTAPLPPARQVPVEQIMSGSEDGQRVEVVGTVRAVTVDKDSIDVDLAAGGYRLHVFPKPHAGLDPASLIGAKVRAKGTVAATFNATLRQMITVAMFMPQPTDFIVEEMEPVSPFQLPLMPLNSIAQYRRDRLPGQRVHIQGVVTFQRQGEDFFLEDESGGLQVKSRQLQALAVGDVVEAVGFPDFDHFLPVMNDAVFRKVEQSRAPAKATVVTIKDIRDGLHHADLVTLPAKVLDRSFQRSQTLGHRAWMQTKLLLQHEDQLFTALAEAPENDTTLAAIPLGSTIEITGVCFTERGEDQRLKSLLVLLPDAKSFRLLEKPSWLTPRRLLIGLGVLFGVLVVAVIWTVLVSKRNAILGGLIREKEQAQLELQQAHDLLEERVKERTTQLKFQISARKEAEVQFKATLVERTRLAQELHDTLEQTLTGIALQLDTTAKLFQSKPEAANRHLELARDQITQSQIEVRRSVWNLRSRALEQFDLPGALATSAKQLMDGAPIEFKMTTAGRVRPLPEIVEDNLLRIGQEALANIVKHSQATTAEINLDYGPQTVRLQITDNGRGFSQAQCAGPAEGHFGLLGISERAKRLNAELDFQSQPGAGTTIIVRVGLDQEYPPDDSARQ